MEEEKSLEDIVKILCQSANFDNFNLPEVDLKGLIVAWKKIITSPELRNYGEGTNEKEQVRPFVEKVLKVIIEEFGLTKIRFIHELQMQNPCRRPDFTFTYSHMPNPSWQDCLSFIECSSTETHRSEAGGRAICHLFNRILYRTDDISDLPELSFSASTNGRTIQFFMVKRMKFDIKKFHSPEMELFDSKNGLSYPSNGFHLLCKFLHFLENSSVPDDLKVNISE